MSRITLLLIACGALAGCLRSTQFQCETDSSCGAGGKCEANKFCSFSDPGCASGRVYGDSAGANAGKCTDENMQQIDGGVDSMTMIDAAKDGGGSNCPQDFVPLAGGHVYKVITTTDEWGNQQAACRAISNNQAYLTVPDTQAELTATDGLTGVGATYWVGINDIAVDGVYRSAFDNSVIAVNAAPWDTQNNQPDSGQGGSQDCADSDTTTHKLSDDRCTDVRRAVCECNP
ncbi:MAG TPA: lectin-like protein [Kofleriaceae bacterium]|jgi:hypothetical protein|nr:lectin-like protein [Kofleriaceae bacterium]